MFLGDHRPGVFALLLSPMWGLGRDQNILSVIEQFLFDHLDIEFEFAIGLDVVCNALNSAHNRRMVAVEGLPDGG